MAATTSFDVIVVGAGHNGLVAATLLARSGRRVLVLERGSRAGGAAVSASPFPGFDVRISRYAYLVSLFPRFLLDELDLRVELRSRRVRWYAPHGDGGVLVCDDEARTRSSLERSGAGDSSFDALTQFDELTRAVAQRVFGSLTEPLRSREEFRRLVGDEQAWQELFEEPLAVALERRFESDLVRGTVATDALIGTFASLSETDLRQNRCFLYHVIGNGTGEWAVPVGGMGALTDALASAAQEAGAELHQRASVIGVKASSDRVEVITANATTFVGRHLLAGVAPGALREMLGEHDDDDPEPEGSQLKLNLLLERLPRLRDDAVTSEEAFAGTFHVNEGYAQLQAAYQQAAAGRIPDPAPCEAYCHSLTDPSIVPEPLRRDGVHTLTVFGLHMPARLFLEDHAAAKEAAVAATLRSLDSVLAEPIEDCLLRSSDGDPCLEAHTPLDIEFELGMPGGHIFHRDLAWPFAETAGEVGRWGVETERPNVWICGAGARRGGAVSGIPGHNAARAVIEADG